MADSSVSTILKSAGGNFDAAWRREFTELTRRLAELRPSASSGKANESASWSKKRVEAFNKATCRSISRARDIVLVVETEANAAPIAKRPSLLLGMEHKKRELERLRRDFRAALLERHRHTLHYDTSQQRQELMDDSEGLREQESSQGVVDSLARSRQVMADQVLRMNSVAVQVLKQDDMLKSTMEEHSGVKGSVGRAQSSLGRLQRVDTYNCMMIVASTAIYVFIMLYVVWARLPFLDLIW
eukprot:341086_1